MARDHALARTLPPGRCVLRLYRWDAPTVSFGRNEPALGRYDPARCPGEVDFVRRPTGGRAVLHHRELTYAVVAPAGALGGFRRGYRLINRALVRSLSFLGVRAELADGTGSTLPPDAGPCFRSPAEGEVTASGRKLVGSAQARLEGVLLQHGSVLLDGTQESLELLKGDRETEDGPWAVTLADLLGGPPSWEAVADALEEGFSRALGGTWERGEMEAPADGVARSLRERYRSDAWTWRR